MSTASRVRLEQTLCSPDKSKKEEFGSYLANFTIPQTRNHILLHNYTRFSFIGAQVIQLSYSKRFKKSSEITEKSKIKSGPSSNISSAVCRVEPRQILLLYYILCRIKILGSCDMDYWSQEFVIEVDCEVHKIQPTERS